MGLLADLMNQAPAATPIRDESLSGDFSHGLRSSALGIGSQLASLGGLAGEVAGQPGMAQSLRAKAADWGAQSQAMQPTVNSVDQIDSFGNGLRWASGIAGTALPYLAGTAAGTVLTGNPLAGGALAMTPPTAGSIVQRQEADPVAMQQTPEARLTNAALGGVAGGAAMSLPFGNVVGKLGGGGLATAAKIAQPRSLLGATARNLGEGAVTAGVGMGGGNVIEQYAANQDKPINFDEALHATKEGAAMGALMHAPFIPGSYMKGRGEQIGEKVGGMVDTVKDKFGKQAEAGDGIIKATGEAVGKMSRGIWDATKDVMPDGMQGYADQAAKYVSESWDATRNGVSKERIAELKTWAEEAMADPDTPAEIKAAMSKSVGNLFNRTNVATIATAKFMRDALKPKEDSSVLRKNTHEKLNDWIDSQDTDLSDANRITKGVPLGDVETLASAQGGHLKTLVGEENAMRVQKVGDMFRKMADDNGLDAAKRAELVQKASDLGNEASQFAVAQMYKGWKASGRFSNKLSGLWESVKPKDLNAGIKQSADLSGFRSALETSVIPYISKNMPELFVRDHDGMRFLHADNSRKLVETLQYVSSDLASGNMSTDSMLRLISTFGEHTVPVVERLLSATKGEPRKNPGGSMKDQLGALLAKQEADPALEQMMELGRLVNRNAELSRVVSEGMDSKVRENYSDADMRELANDLLEWARGHHVPVYKGTTGGAKPRNGGVAQRDMFVAKGEQEPAKYSRTNDPTEAFPAGKTETGEPVRATRTALDHDPRMRAKFEELFGERADAVSHAFEKEAIRGYREDPLTSQGTEDPMNHYDRDGNRVTEENLERVVRGYGKPGKEKLVRSPEQWKAAKAELEDWAQGWAEKEGHGGVYKSEEYAKRKAAIGDAFNTGAQVLADMAKDPKFHGFDLKWEQAEGRAPGWGYIAASRNADADRFTHNDIEYMKWQSKTDEKTGKATESSQNRVVGTDPRTGDMVEIDSLRAAFSTAKKMRGRETDEAVTETSIKARAALEAYAKLMDYFDGKVKIPKDAAWGILGKDAKGETQFMTIEQAGKLARKDSRNPLDREAGKADEHAMDRGDADPFMVEELQQRAVEREQNPDDGYGAIIREENRNLVQEARSHEGRRSAGPMDDVVTAAADRSDDVNLEHTVNEVDGTSTRRQEHFTARETRQINVDMRQTIGEWAVAKGVGAEAIALKANQILTFGIRSMSKKDRTAFLELVDKTPAKAAELVNHLFDKYASAIRSFEGEKAKELPARKDVVFAKKEEKSAPKVSSTLEEKPMFEAGAPSKEMPQTMWPRKGKEPDPQGRLPFEEGSPDPKAVAAKKAALREKAASGDPKLLEELSTSTDVAGLARAVEELNSPTVAESRSSMRAELLVGNKYRKDLQALTGALDDMNQTPSFFTSKDGDLTLADFRARPLVAAIRNKLMAKRLAGDSDAIQVLDALRHTEYQFFSLENAKKTNGEMDRLLGSANSRKLGEYMDAVSKASDVPLVLREIAQAIGKVAGDTEVSPGKLSGMGIYDGAANKIQVDAAHGNKTATVIHEGAHAATFRALAKDEKLNRAVFDLMEHISTVSPRISNAYAMKNAAEFLAEGMANRLFQKELQTIKANSKVREYLGENVANAWDAFVAVVRKALKLDPAHDSALSQMFELAGHAMRNVHSDRVKGISIEEGHAWVDRLFVSSSDFSRVIGELKSHLQEGDKTGYMLDSLISRAEAEQGTTYSTMHTAEQFLATINDRKRTGADASKYKGDALTNALSYVWDGMNGRASILPREIARAIDTANDRIAELTKDPQTAYDMLTKRSAQTPGNKPVGARAEKNMEKYLVERLGPAVDFALKQMGHAGEHKFDATAKMDVIRVSTTALNPMSVAHHEALHAFFGHLHDAKMSDVTYVVEKLSAAPHIMAQLRERLKNSPEALNQLKNPEERAAYMFQYYTTDKTFKIQPEAKTLFAKISEVIHNLLGMWTNDQRAIEIMNYFENKEFAADRGDMYMVHDKLMKAGRNAAIEKIKSFSKPLAEMGNALAGMAGNRIRDFGVPALTEIVDKVKTTGREQGGDRGYYTTAREERSARLNKYAEEAQRFTPDEHRAALEAAQNGTKATGRARLLQVITQRTLDQAWDYAKAKGVSIGLLQDPNGVHYFPRVWDAHYISKNQPAFLSMVEKYVRSGEFAGDPKELMRTLIANEGNSFNVVTRQPGLQFRKERLLRFMDHADVAPFLQKDLLVTVDSYITQMTRRAEFANRFGDDGVKLNAMFAEAQRQGATRDQLAATENFLKGVDGTLGDDIDPGLRRAFGNAIIYQNLRLLPLALFSSLPDAMGLMVRGAPFKTAAKTFMRGLKEIPEGFRKLENRTKSADERMAEVLGVIDNAFLHSSLGALYNQGMVSDFGRRVNDTFFKYNMMEQYNRTMRSGATAAAIEFIATHADGKASVHSARWMQELGLGTDMKPEFKADGSLKVLESDGLTKAKADRMRQAVNQWVDGAVLRPDAVDKPTWFNDPHFALIAHLKQFTWSFQETILKRAFHEAQNGNMRPVAALGSYVPIMIASDMAKGLIQGAGSQPSWRDDWGPTDYIASGIQRASLLGVGQLGVDAITSLRHGGTGLGTLAGPSLEQLGDAVAVLGGRKQFAPFVLHSMPANAVYSDWVQSSGSAGADPGKPYEPIAAE